VRWDYLLPLQDEGWLQTLRATFSVFAFPFGETIIFASLLPFVMDARKVLKKSLLALILTGLLLCGLSLLQSAVLGEEITRTSFPGLALLREIRVADFLTRLEVLGIFVWTFASFIKLSTCFWALAQGLAQLVGISDYRPLIFPLGIIITVLSVTTVKSFSELTQFTQVIYPLFTFPLQVLIPLLLLILTRLKPATNK
jgi:spore germination protein KB